MEKMRVCLCRRAAPSTEERYEMCRKVRKKVKTLGRSAGFYSNELSRSTEHTDGRLRGTGLRVCVHVTENSTHAARPCGSCVRPAAAATA